MLLKRIKELRVKNGFSQQEIADLLRISQSQYCKYESGLSVITSDRLDLLATLYNTSVDYILQRTDIIYPYLKQAKDIKERAIKSKL